MVGSKNSKPIALWATPRTVSTAFDKMMRTRGDIRVFTEPFSFAYYMGPDKLSPRYEISAPDVTFESVLQNILGAVKEGPVFVKDMAYQLGPMLTGEVLSKFKCTFLIRDPARALCSMSKVWPDFTDDEAGYVKQHEAWNILRQQGNEPIVIDSDDLRRDPEFVIGAWCDAVGLPRRPDALNWEPGMPDDWLVWGEWFQTVSKTTGFLPPEVTDPPVPSDALAKKIAACRPLYDELAVNRICKKREGLAQGS